MKSNTVTLILLSDLSGHHAPDLPDIRGRRYRGLGLGGNAGGAGAGHGGGLVEVFWQERGDRLQNQHG